MEKRARKEVQRFKEQCNIASDYTGQKILQALVHNWKDGNGQGAEELCTSASPKKVAMWIRDEGYHPVIWHMVKGEYQFASELHAKEATKILENRSQSSA